MLVRRVPLVVVLSAAGMGAPLAAAAQQRDVRITAGVGISAYDGASGEAGFGPVFRLGIAVPRSAWLTLHGELVQQHATAVGASCSLGVPGECFPEEPASPMRGLRVGASLRAPGVRAVVLLAGVGVLTGVGRADRATNSGPTADAGLGLRLSRTVMIELRAGAVWSSHGVGALVPLGITLSF